VPGRFFSSCVRGQQASPKAEIPGADEEEEEKRRRGGALAEYPALAPVKSKRLFFYTTTLLATRLLVLLELVRGVSCNHSVMAGTLPRVPSSRMSNV